VIKLKVQVTSAGLIVNTKKQLRSVMRKAGAEVAAAARSKIGTGGPSQPGQPPNVRNAGHDKVSLKRSIKVFPFKSGEGVAIRATAFYAKMLEGGAKGGGRKGKRNRRGKPSTQRVLLPRPFLSTALAEREASLGQRIRDAIVSDIAFKRTK
jgi:hypothetical protein